MTASALTEPEYLKKFCPKCGEPTQLRCEFCNFPIQGINLYHEILYVNDYTIPHYCHNCGKPYPWTEMQIRAAKNIIDLLDELKSSEKEEFKKSVDEIVNQTPNAKTAAYKIKLILTKVRGETQKMIRDILVDITSEVAVKIIMPDR
ncbi:MAG TPA: DUF2321 domain-containing protein [Methanoregula sp.]|nr:DUF2321 domain-containing protein [Methanoregula sp.]